MNIVKLMGELSNREFKFTSGEWEFIKETKQYYVIKSPVTSKYLEKDELNIVIHQSYNDAHHPISFFSYCEADKIEIVKSMMVDQACKTLERIEEELKLKRSVLIKHL